MPASPAIQRRKNDRRRASSLRVPRPAPVRADLVALLVREVRELRRRVEAAAVRQHDPRLARVLRSHPGPTVAAPRTKPPRPRERSRRDPADRSPARRARRRDGIARRTASRPRRRRDPARPSGSPRWTAGAVDLSAFARAGARRLAEARGVGSIAEVDGRERARARRGAARETRDRGEHGLRVARRTPARAARCVPSRAAVAPRSRRLGVRRSPRSACSSRACICQICSLGIGELCDCAFAGRGEVTDGRCERAVTAVRRCNALAASTVTRVWYTLRAFRCQHS